MSTRKYFEAVAAALKETRPDQVLPGSEDHSKRARWYQWCVMVEKTAAAGKESSPSFDFNQFVRACGHPDYSKR